MVPSRASRYVKSTRFSLFIIAAGVQLTRLLQQSVCAILGHAHDFSYAHAINSDECVQCCEGGSMQLAKALSYITWCCRRSLTSMCLTCMLASCKRCRILVHLAERAGLLASGE